MKKNLNRMDAPTRRTIASYLASTCLGVGILPSLLATKSAHAQSSRRSAQPAEHVIYLYMSGGMSHLDTLDPKPGQDTAGPVDAIPTNVSGIRLSEYMPNLAKVMDKAAIISSMTTTTGAHEQGRYYMRTSYPMRGTIKHPGVGTWLLQSKGPINPSLPGYLLVGGGSGEATSGFMETKYAPVPIGNPNGGLPYSKITDRPGMQWPKGLKPEQRGDYAKADFYDRLDLANEFDIPFREKYEQKQVKAYTDLYVDAIKLLESKDLEAFDLSKETPETRAAYGNNNFGSGCLLARRLVEEGIRAIEVHLGGWDTHSDNFNSLSTHVPTLDQALGTLIADLDSRGLLSKTLVVLTTEFGRTPNINVNVGRDHHPASFSTLVAGGPIQGGQIYGKTDEKGNRVADKPVTIPDFNATIGMALGLDIERVVKSQSGRPFTFADKGKPIAELT